MGSPSEWNVAQCENQSALPARVLRAHKKLIRRVWLSPMFFFFQVLCNERTEDHFVCDPDILGKTSKFVFF